MSPARRQLLKLGLATLGAGGGLIWSVARSGSAIMSLPLRSALPEASKNEGWPTLFGPRHDSISREPGIVAGWTAAGPRELWRINVGTGYSSPVAMADSIYLLHRLGDEEVVEAFHIDTGESRWQQRYPTQFRCRFEYSHGPYASPVIDGDRLYTYGAEGVLHCWELRTGRVIWSRALNREYEVPEPLFGASSSPLIEGELLILNVGGTKHGAGIVAVDKHSGKTIWKSLADGAGYATAKAATIADRHYIFTLTHEHFVALDPVDGRVYWQIPFCSKLPDACNATSPLVVDDLVLVCCGPGPGSLCVQVLPDGSYRQVWSDRRVLDSTWTNLVHVAGYVYGCSSKRRRAALQCVELSTGKLMWSHESDLGRAATLVAGGRLIAWGEQGNLVTIELNHRQAIVGSLMDEPLLEPPCYSAPALHRGRLVVRNEREMLALDLRATST